MTPLERIAERIRAAAPLPRPSYGDKPSQAPSPQVPHGVEPARPPQGPGSAIAFPGAAGEAGGPLPEAPPWDGPAPHEAVENQPSQTGGSPAKPRGQEIGAEDAVALNRRLAFIPLTDLGNAERFRERNQGKFIFVVAVGWYWWDGRRWSREGADERVKIAGHMTVRSIQHEAASIEDTPHDKPMGSRGRGKESEVVMLSALLRAWGRTSEANSRMTPIATHAAAYLAAQPIQLDADPFAINVLNGTIRIDRKIDGYVTFHGHDPKDLCTKLAPIDYDPKATCDKFAKFIADIQPGIATRRTLQAWKGYALTGDISEHKVAVFWGNGKNGKSVLEEITAFVAGDYCGNTPIETFLADGRARSGGQATPDLAKLPGIRMLRTSEPKKGAHLDEGLIKAVSGGEPIDARHLNRDYFTFYPSFKLTISGNYRPKIVGADEGIWRRIVLVPFTVEIAKEKQDKQLAVKLRDEAAGILNWMLDGLRDWLDHGLQFGEEVEAATAEYRRDSDQLGRFLEACTVRDPGARVQSSVLHATFNAWSRANSLNEWKGRGFSDAMTERGFKRDKSSVVYFLDLQLTKSVGDFIDHEGRVLTSSGALGGREGSGGWEPDDLTF